MKIMKTIVAAILPVASALGVHAQTKVLLTVGDKTKTAILAENAATRDLLEMLRQGPVTVRMSDYGGFEKVGALPGSLAAADSEITTEPGDIMLYQSNNIVIFYGSNTWSYTRLGKIDAANANEVREFLGSGNIELVISADTSSAIYNVGADEKAESAIYDLSGRRLSASLLKPGIYIINGKKTLVSDLKNC